MYFLKDNFCIFQQNPTGNMMFINLNNTETQQLNLDTRHCQLEVAIQVEYVLFFKNLPWYSSVKKKGA